MSSPWPSVDGVGLDAQRIDQELIAPLAVVERVENHGDEIVGENVLALGPSRAHLAGLLVADENGVEALAVVGEVGDSLPAGRLAVGGLALAEIRDPRLVLRLRPLEEILDLGRARNPGNSHAIGAE